MRREITLLKDSLSELTREAVLLLGGSINYTLENFSEKELRDFYKHIFTELIADLEEETNQYLKKCLIKNRDFLEDLRIDERIKLLLVAKKTLLQKLSSAPFFAGASATRITTMLEESLVEIAYDYEIEIMKSETADMLVADEIADELYKTRKKLEQQKRFITSLLENSPDAIALLDSKRRVRLWNASAAELIGYKPVMLLGKSLEKLTVHDGDFRAMMREADKKGKLFGVELTLRRADESIIPASLSVSIIDAESEKEPAYVLVIRDASEIRQMRDRVIDAERLSAMAKIAGAVAHEVRNPLNSLTLNLDLLEDSLPEQLNDKAKKQLYIFREEIEKLSAIVSNYLSLSKLSKIEFKPTLIFPFLNQTIQKFNEDREIGTGLIKLISTEPPKNLYANLDLHQFTRALTNLFQNALEATHYETGVYDELHPIVLFREEDEGLRIEISDTGDGIPSEFQEKLFTPFYSTKTGGTGLGLYIVREIIQAHRGEIEIKNKSNGKGAIASIIIPKMDLLS
ncbi:MAG: ATP-binding protein [Chloroherpetonaceae bacterium]|nr:ATP-binding protein [Chloroherpetonaceae bacterium]